MTVKQLFTIIAIFVLATAGLLFCTANTLILKIIGYSFYFIAGLVVIYEAINIKNETLLLCVTILQAIITFVLFNLVIKLL